MLQCVAACCSVLQCIAVCCSVLRSDAVCCSELQCVAIVYNCVAVFFGAVVTLSLIERVLHVNRKEAYGYCSVLQCVAVWCSVLQCVAVCCSSF